MVKIISKKLRAEHRELYERLAAAQRTKSLSVAPTDRMDADEDKAWDALVDWVDENDLTFTELDPRGPDSVYDEETQTWDRDERAWHLDERGYWVWAT